MKTDEVNRNARALLTYVAKRRRGVFAAAGM
jgi:hypothetical protein